MPRPPSAGCGGGRPPCESEFLLALGPDLTIRSCSEAFACWLGLSPRERLEGRPLADLVDPASRAKLAMLAERAAEGPCVLELNHRRADGRAALATYRVLPPGTVDPEQRHVLLVGSDGQRSLDLMEEVIGLKREREAQLALERAAHERLRRLDADFQSVAHVIHHDVMNALNAVALIAAVLGRKAGPSPDELAEASREIDDNCRHIGRALRGLVVLADEGRPAPEPESVDLREQARGAVARVAALFPDVDHRVEFRLEARTAWATPDHVRQILEHVLTNAFQYRDPSRLPLCVIVATRAEGSRVAIEVADNGRGVPDSRQARVFEPFADPTADGPPERRVPGLGLAVVRRLVELNRGALWLSSTPGAGTVVRIALPAEPARVTRPASG